MAGYPDFSDSDSNLSDDCDYYDFKQRVKSINGAPEGSKVRVETEEEKRLQQEQTLYHVILSGNVVGLTELLDNGLDVNLNWNHGWTPLLLGASFGNPDITRELVLRGADVNTDNDGETALMVACNCPKSTSPFERSLDVIKQLVEKGANVRAINKRRMTALMLAASVGNLLAVKYLLPLSNKNAEDNEKRTTLFWAINMNAVEVVKYLLQEGVNYTITDIRGHTPLDIARSNDFNEIVELFPKEEADVLPSIIESRTYTYEETFSNLKKGEKPAFFLDICNILCGIKSEAVIKLLADKKINLYEFLSISDEKLKNLGVVLPYQRNRILGGLHKFHMYPYHPKSLHIVPLKESYSNLDMAIQLLSNIRQIIAMEASLAYIIKNYADKDVPKTELKLLAQNVHNIQNKIKLCKVAIEKLREKTEMLDNQVKPVDLITAQSRKYRIPWRRLIFSFSVISLVLVFKRWK